MIKAYGSSGRNVTNVTDRFRTPLQGMEVPVRLAPFIVLGLTGCQLIINHNTFEPGDADSPADSLIDDAPEPANAVYSTSAAGTVIVGALIAADGTILSQDGNWLTTVALRSAFNTRRFDMTFAPFDAKPTCTCSSSQGNNHGCNFTNVEPGTATVNVFSAEGTARDVYVMCVGVTSRARPNLVSSPSNSTITLASVRMSTSGEQQLEDGDWVESVDTTDMAAGLWALLLNPEFAAPPQCGCTWTGSGSIECKIEQQTQVTKVPVSMNGGAANGPVSADVICLGRSTTNTGGFVVSPQSSGTVVASATIRGASNTVDRQDGSWISSVTGGPTHIVTFHATLFGDTPRCLCTSQDTDLVACHVTNFTSPTMQVVSATAAATSVESDFSLICTGARP